MSPELLDPEKFGASDPRPTKESDRFALGMVFYEVRVWGYCGISRFFFFAKAYAMIGAMRTRTL